MGLPEATRGRDPLATPRPGHSRGRISSSLTVD